MRTRLAWLVIVGTLCALPWACREDPAPPERVTPTEAQRLRAAIARLRAAQEAMRCPRPVLRGRPLPGSGEVALAAVAEGREHARCLDTVDAGREALEAALFLTFEGLPAGWPRRNPWLTLRPSDASAVPPAIEAVAAVCAPLVEDVREAVRYQDACSPYRPGRARPAPARLESLALALAASARHRWAAEDDRAAAEILLDGLRLLDDLARGGARIEVQAAAVRARTPLAVTLEGLLDRPAPLGPSLPRQIEAELATLAATRPSPSASLRGLWASLLLDIDLPGTDLPDDALLPIAGLHLLAEQVATACPADAPAHRCVAALREADARLGELTRLDGRSGALAESMVTFVGPYADHLRQRALRDVVVPGLRTLATWRRVVEATGDCPRLDAFDVEPLRSARRDPFKDGLLKVVPHAEDRFLVSIDGWPDGDDLETAPPGVVLQCPVTRALTAAE